ncbi:MAG: hypothetical protein M1837_007154 [Sclerophora amabilis]|nr:MAG: hypothetical protein M1837_007154 [Sclerophora amabilis]
MTSQKAGVGRKRANSAGKADASKRTKPDHGTAGADDGGQPLSQKRRNSGKQDATVGATDSRKKRKIDRKDDASAADSKISNGTSNREASADPLLTSPSEARPTLGDKKLVQAVPAAATSADNKRGTGQEKVDSWEAFKTAALILKEAGHESSTPFKNCALEYRFDPEGDKPAGAYFIAEIELKGPLSQICQVFGTVLGVQEPVLRVTAFLGVTLAADKDIAIDSLTLVGCFVGCNVQYPADSKLVRITSLGATISITKKGEAVLLDVAKAAVLPSVIAEEVGSSLALQETLVSETAMALSTPLEESKSSALNGTAKGKTLELKVAKDGEEAEEEEEEDGEGDGEGEMQDDEEEEGKEDEEQTEDEEQVSRHINYSIFGTVEVPVPGQPLALTVDLDLSIVKGMLLFTMSPKGSKKAWDNVFGFDNIDLVDVVFKIGYPLIANKDDDMEEGAEKDDEKGSDGLKQGLGHDKGRAGKKREDEETKKAKEFSDLMEHFGGEEEKEKDSQPFVALQAGWDSPIGEVTILGKITQDFVSSTLKGTLCDVTFAKIKQLYERIHNVSLGETDIDIQAKTLVVELSKEGLRLEGDLTICDKKVTATLLLSTEGISLSAKTPKWEVDDEKVLTIEDAEVSLFIGCAGKKSGDAGTAAKELEKSVGWYGGLRVKGTFVYRKDLKITVTLQIMGKVGGGWGYIVIGQAESNLSLADLVSYCPKNGDLDFSLKNVWLVASNVDVDPAMLPPDAQKFPVKKGLFLCTYLDTVPLIDGKSKIVKKADPKDVAYLYIGLQSGGLPSVAIYLPKTMSVDLGSRTKVGDFYCRLSAGTSGPRVEFIGHVEMLLAAIFHSSWMASLRTLSGLSDRIALGATEDGQKLGIQVGVIWTQLAATGLPAALGLSGTLSLDYGTPKAKTYGMTVNLSENPMDFIIIINATSLSYSDLVDIASALTSTPIPAGDVSGATFKNLEVYASLGGSFGSQTYPPGLRMRGIMCFNNKEAYFSCDISTSGLKLLACVPSFELGCLKVSGEKDLPETPDWPVAMQQLSTAKLAKGDPDKTALVASQRYQGKYALLDLQITLAKQSFLLNGKIEIFGLMAYANIECQYKPVPNFSFDFWLQWNGLFKLQLHAKMLDSKYLDRPRDADFEVSAVFEQTIFRQILETLTAVLKATSETLTKGVGKVKAEIKALEEKKRELLELAIQRFVRAENDLAQERAGIEQKIRDNKQRTLDRGRKLEEEKAEIQARREQRQREADEKRRRDKQEARERKEQREAAERDKLARVQRERDLKASQKSQQQRDIQSKYGGITADDVLRGARNAVNEVRGERDHWARRVDEINGWYHPVDESDAMRNCAAAEVNLFGLESAVGLLEELLNSDAFREATNFLNELGDKLQTLTAELDNAYQTVNNAISVLGDELNDTVREIDQVCDTMINDTQCFLKEKSAELDNFIDEQQEALDKLSNDLQAVVNGIKAEALAIAREGVEKIKNDDTLLTAANKGLDSFDQLQRGAFDTLDEIIKTAVGDLVDIDRISLVGKITADAKQQSPFVITIKGRFGKTKEFLFELEWMPWRPGADDTTLFKRLASMVMAFLNGDAVGLSKASKAIM